MEAKRAENATWSAKYVGWAVMKRYNDKCQLYRDLPLQDKLFKMAEAILDVDLRIVKEFQAVAVVALGAVLKRRMVEICRMLSDLTSYRNGEESKKFRKRLEKLGAVAEEGYSSPRFGQGPIFEERYRPDGALITSVLERLVGPYSGDFPDRYRHVSAREALLQLEWLSKFCGKANRPIHIAGKGSLNSRLDLVLEDVQAIAATDSDSLVIAGDRRGSHDEVDYGEGSGEGGNEDDDDDGVGKKLAETNAVVSSALADGGGCDGSGGAMEMKEKEGVEEAATQTLTPTPSQESSTVTAEESNHDDDDDAAAPPASQFPG
jgi:hypothetical protein